MSFVRDEFMLIAFGRAVVLDAGNSALHFHRSAPVVHNRGGFSPCVIAALPEAEIFGGAGYIALSSWLRAVSGNCYAEVEFFPGLGTRSEQL